MAPAPKRRNPSRSAGQTFRRLDAALLRVVDGAVAGCILLVPFLMGGRQALGRLTLVGLAALAALAWLVREGIRPESRWRFSAAEWLLLAALLLVLVQLAPLPPSTLAALSPRIGELLPLWGEPAEGSPWLGAWNSVSLTPGKTRAGLAVLLAYAMLFLVTVQRIDRLEDVERQLRWIATAAVAMAAFGLVQFLTSNGKFFWFYEHPYSRTSDVAKGAFTNRNHFAHFLALGLGPLVWWLQDRRGRRAPSRERHFTAANHRAPPPDGVAGLKTVALGILLFAGLLSLSRGGALVMLLAAALSVGACYRAKGLGRRFVLSLAGVAVLIGVLLSIYGYDQVTGRLDTLRAGSLEAVDSEAARRTIWATVVRAAGDFALLGSGVGSHRDVYPMYLEHPPDRVYTHAESGPLQVLLETGAVGLTLAVAAVGLCGFWCAMGLRRAASPRMLAAVGAVAAGLAANAVHSLADFVWYVPGCMAVVAVLAGSACRAYQLASDRSRHAPRDGLPHAEREVYGTVAVPRWILWSGAAAVLLLGGWMVENRLGPAVAERHWDRYRTVALAAESFHPLSLPQPRTQADGQLQPDAAATGPAGEEGHSGDQFADNLVGTSLRAAVTLAAELEQVVAHDPDHARAHLRLAAAYLRRFDLEQQQSENAMPLSQIRDAALAARRHSTPEQVAAWLKRVLGERREYLDLAAEHARRGLALAPLQGEGYLFLAQLCFLEDGGAADPKAAYLHQALAVRPYDGTVLFEAGREAWLAGDFPRGLELWQQSFRAGRRHQKQLIHLLCGRVPLEFLVEAFEPDLVGMRLIHNRCRELGDPLLLADACRYHGEAAVAAARSREGPEAAEIYLEACWLAGRLYERELAVECARKAFQHNPNTYAVREALAQSLVAADRAAEAEEHLRWCLARRPHSEKLKTLSGAMVRRRIDRQAREDPAVQPATYVEEPQAAKIRGLPPTAIPAPEPPAPSP